MNKIKELKLNIKNVNEHIQVHNDHTGANQRCPICHQSGTYIYSIVTHGN